MFSYAFEIGCYSVWQEKGNDFLIVTPMVKERENSIINLEVIRV